METRPLLLAGKRIRTSETLPVQFPFTGEKTAKVSLAGDAELDMAAQASFESFAKTRKMSAHSRIAVLRKLMEIMGQRREELVETLILEGGKPRIVARMEVNRALETIRICSEEVSRIHGKTFDLDATPDGEGRKGILRRFPVGPVLAITPFNYPLNLACHKVGPAMAVGNPILLKPASATPLSALILGEMILEAGYPPEALSVLPCPGQASEILVKDPRIAFITFTGSSEVGWRIKSLAGRKNTSLELGGNAAVIVHEDASIDFAARRIIVGGFANSGQNCISVQRVLAHRPIYEDLLAKITDGVKALKAGDPREEDTVVGPLINEKAAVEAMAKVGNALDKGAKALCGASRQGAVMSPTVLGGITTDMRVSREEIFAPVAAVMPYDDFDEALTLANGTEYGLQHGVFTRDIGRIMQAYEELQSGGVIVNDVSTFRVDQMPYGGIKNSGIGKEGPRYAMEEMTSAKLLVLNLSV